VIALVRYAGLFGVNVLPIGTATADRLVHAAVILQAALLVLYAGAILGRHRGAAPLTLLPRSSSRAATGESRPAIGRGSEAADHAAG
jgi:hypothetical protein